MKQQELGLALPTTDEQEEINRLARINVLLQEVAELNKSLRAKHEDLDKARADQPVVCEKCGTVHRVKNLEYIQTHWYTSPSGCTDGDYWNVGEGQYQCPVCETIWRLYDCPELTSLKHLFKSVRDTYDRR